MKKFILNYFIICFLCTNFYLHSQTDSQKTGWEHITEREKIKRWGQFISDSLHSAPEKCLSYAKAGLSLSKKINSISDEIRFTCSIGDIHKTKGNYNTALEYYRKAYKIALDSNLEQEKSILAERLGLVYETISDYDKAIEYFMQCLEVREKDENNKLNLFNILLNLGSVYQLINKLELAEDYYQRALKISKELDDKNSLGSISLNLGGLYAKKKEFDKSLQYLQKALTIYRELDDNVSVIQTLNNLASIYFEQKDYQKTLELYKKAYRLSNDINDDYIKCLFFTKQKIRFSEIIY